MQLFKPQPHYHSQNGEDYLLSSFFGFKQQGFYVDVGAFDGVHLSNTLTFEQQGWLGICIEPNPDYFARCQQARPRSTCIHAACISDPSVDAISFYQEELGLLSGTTSDRDYDIQARYQKRGLEFTGFNQIQVPATTLNTLLSSYVPPQSKIDFISIDVEGTELDVLRGLDLNRFRPRVLVIEANSESSKQHLNQYLVEQNRYIEARTVRENIFYTANSQDAKRLNALAIHCQLESNPHPLGPRYTAIAYSHRRTVVDKTYSRPKQYFRQAKQWIKAHFI